jgi:hypothetical protein
MFRKTVVFSVAVALLLLGLYVDPSAAVQPNVTSVSKKGSLVVLPSIITVEGFDTIVTIGNDAGSPVWIKCYWMDQYQKAWDFEVPLTANQSIWFSAKTGAGTKPISEFGEQNIGELKCWAIDINAANADTEILTKYNHLYASAFIVANHFGFVEAWEYQAWAFALNRALPVADAAGPLNLNGTDYDFCPAYLAYNFFAEDANLTDGRPAFDYSILALSPCQQDLRQDNAPICTKAKFDIWNENEIKFTGAYQCIKCWWEGELGDMGYEVFGPCENDIGYGRCKTTGVGGSKFTKKILQTNMGRFRVTPDSFKACQGVFTQLDQDGESIVDRCKKYDDLASGEGPYLAKVYKTPFVGVLITTVYGPSTLTATNAAIATTGVGAGVFSADTQPEFNPGVKPQILWDAGEKQQNAPKR